MINRLLIRNLATIEKQIVEFDKGFTVLTGETGAGKSVIIKAVRLILGEKCPKDLIRAGENFLSVEATFHVSDNPPLLELLQELDVEHEGEITVRRKVHATGKNSVFINDYSFNLSILARFAEFLVDLHGQHSQQTLLKPATHIDYLDEFAGLREQVSEFSHEFQAFNRKKREFDELTESASNRMKEMDFIRFQISEIDHAGFTEDEEQQLLDEVQRLTNSEKLIESLQPVADWQDRENSPLAAISSSLPSLKNAAKTDSSLAPSVEEIQTGLITLEEAVSEISRYLSNLEVNPGRLEEVNKRLSELDKLKRKYGETVNDILTYREQKQSELDRFENLEFNYGALEKELGALLAGLKNKADSLSEARNSFRETFEKVVTGNLQELGMERSQFQVKLELPEEKSPPEELFHAKGKDHVEFLISTNPGTPMKPLNKIASGGELSRIMLAIKTTLNRDITLGTMIFDEVDAGISGRVAETVGIKLHDLGRAKQVICITHSPQIAARAKDHLRVEKIVNANSSKTLIQRLKGDERIEEIARFLGGEEITEKTRAVAKDMLSN